MFIAWGFTHINIYISAVLPSFWIHKKQQQTLYSLVQYLLFDTQNLGMIAVKFLKLCPGWGYQVLYTGFVQSLWSFILTVNAWIWIKAAQSQQKML